MGMGVMTLWLFAASIAPTPIAAAAKVAKAILKRSDHFAKEFAIIDEAPF